MHVGVPQNGDVDATAGDVCVCAPTGSGKTLAYSIPIVNVHLHMTIHN